MTPQVSIERHGETYSIYVERDYKRQAAPARTCILILSDRHEAGEQAQRWRWKLAAEPNAKLHFDMAHNRLGADLSYAPLTTGALVELEAK